MHYVGVDLAWGQKSITGLAVLDGKQSLRPSGRSTSLESKTRSTQSSAPTSPPTR